MRGGQVRVACWHLQGRGRSAVLSPLCSCYPCLRLLQALTASQGSRALTKKSSGDLSIVPSLTKWRAKRLVQVGLALLFPPGAPAHLHGRGSKKCTSVASYAKQGLALCSLAQTARASRSWAGFTQLRTGASFFYPRSSLARKWQKDVCNLQGSSPKPCPRITRHSPRFPLQCHCIQTHGALVQVALCCGTTGWALQAVLTLRLAGWPSWAGRRC